MVVDDHNRSENTSTIGSVVRPVMRLPLPELSGYLNLDGQESKFRSVAFDHHAEAARLWFRFLALLDQAIQEQARTPFEVGQYHENELRYQLFAVSAGSAKLAFDGILAGYYAQSFMIIRHMLETWLRVVHIGLYPAEAVKWYAESDGQPSTRVKTLVSLIRQRVTNPQQRATLHMVRENIETLDDMAHPYIYTMLQTQTESGNQIQFGANYNQGLCRQALHHGAGAMQLLLEQWDVAFPLSRQWKDSFESTVRDLHSS